MKPETFKKSDAGKPRPDLLPPLALIETAKVLEFGARKYSDNNWLKCPTRGRYVAALLRHVLAWMSGEDKDAETGLSHMAHAACCVLFILEYELRGLGEDSRPPPVVKTG